MKINISQCKREIINDPTRFRNFTQSLLSNIQLPSKQQCQLFSIVFANLDIKSSARFIYLDI